MGEPRIYPGRVDVEAADYDLSLIAQSGQSFRWRRVEGEAQVSVQGQAQAPCAYSNERAALWQVPALGDVAALRQEGRRISFACTPGRERDWLCYLRLDPASQEAHAACLRALARRRSPMPAIVRAYGGLEVLAQDPWEAAVSFVISQNNNIKRIRSSLERICGGPLEPLPTPYTLSRILAAGGRDLGLGYRLPYLQDLAARWSDLEEAFSRSRDLPPAKAYHADYEALLAVNGIGPKVANCICLYGLGHLGVVPVDTWIRKAQDRYGFSWHRRYGGLQQLMVFEWARRLPRS